MHLRMPSIDQGVQAFVWALVFFLFIWLGRSLVGFPGGTSFVIALVVGGAIFLFVRDGDTPARSAAAPRSSRIRRDASASALDRLCVGCALSAATSRSAKSRPRAASSRLEGGLAFAVRRRVRAPCTSARRRGELGRDGAS